jgi:PKD repeat protein
MQKLQALTIAFTFVVMCFSGCLETNEDKQKNRAPNAVILMPGLDFIGEAGKPFQIDGSVSSDPDGDELNYMWTLTGLGSPIDLSTKMSDFITIDAPGNDLILTLLVRDPDGLTHQDFRVFNVEPGNRPPIANIITPSNGGSYSEGKTVTFDGMASSDPDNDLISYEWSLTEIESGQNYKIGPTNQGELPGKFKRDLSEGDYSVTLTVEDPDGETNAVTHSFSVTNLPPVAIISSDKNSVFTEEAIQFSGDDSYDPEGDALDYLWNFGDNQTSSLKSPQHSWGEAGRYTVTLTVEDGNGQEGTSSKSIEIKSLGPSAQFIFEDDSGNNVEKVRTNSNITLDGSETTAPDGEIKEYKWDFGDGVERTTNESSTDYSWSAGGYYNVTLIVVDENDKTGEITKILQVVPEDYTDEGSDGTLVAQDSGENYNIDVEIFVSIVLVEFQEINCVGIGGQIDYTITVLDSEENEIGQNGGNVACGGEGANWNIEFYNEDNALNLGNYQITIAFTNSGTPVQVNWNYRFAVVYEF